MFCCVGGDANDSRSKGHQATRWSCILTSGLLACVHPWVHGSDTQVTVSYLATALVTLLLDLDIQAHLSHATYSMPSHEHVHVGICLCTHMHVHVHMRTHMRTHTCKHKHSVSPP